MSANEIGLQYVWNGPLSADYFGLELT